jgi:hypothetical protein
MINSGLKRRANIIINYELGIMNAKIRLAVLQLCSSAVLQLGYSGNCPPLAGGQGVDLKNPPSAPSEGGHHPG